MLSGMRPPLLWLWCATWLGLAGCSGDYPLPPTRCDEWCDATKGRTCPKYYNPASCVSQCERASLDMDVCREQFDAVLACYRSSTTALEQACNYDFGQQGCSAETGALDTCVAFNSGLIDQYD
jgi:hypothetical protein